jgi:hypothetical protein
MKTKHHLILYALFSEMLLKKWLFIMSAAIYVLFTTATLSGQTPDPVVPVYSKLKDLHLTTSLVSASTAAVNIVSPAIYRDDALKIADAIKKITKVNIPVISDEAPEASMPLKGNLILLGNRSTSKAVNTLYDLGYTFIDLKYPGKGGFVVKSLHNPFGNGKNVLFAGGSDNEGVSLAVTEFIRLLQSEAGKKKTRDFSVGYMSSIKLGSGYVLPDDVRKAEIWEASEYYQSSGYFGWNMLSKNMALYYMTGQERYLKEFIRLAFPDATAIKEIEDYDGERIENKNDPLSGPYHYSAHMMILLWDLIEESPAFTDELRLKITNSFARQLSHRVVEGVYKRTAPPEWVGDRHADWSAFSLYVLGRYFQKDYPDPVWENCIKAADLYFSALGKTFWTGGNNDHLFWFTSYYDPMINYLVMSEKRDKDILGNLRKALNTQEILSTGLKQDWGIKASSLSMLNKAAYILNDGRWLYYREKANLDTEVFRLGQSFWPGPELKSAEPDDLSGKWNIQQMPAEMYNHRHTGFLPEESFRWGSYRSEPGPKGDYILIKGYNGAGRNPYHTFDILELRIDGSTVLKGYGNQVLSGADGMVEPKVAMDARLISSEVLGDIVSARAEVPDLPFVKWKRSLVLKKGKYVIIADELTFRTNSQNLMTETSWETPGGKWNDSKKCIEIPAQRGFELYSSDSFGISDAKGVINMKWKGSVKDGEKRNFYHLIGPAGNSNSCLRLSPEAALLSFPDKAVAVTGKFRETEGDLVLLSGSYLYATGLKSAGIGRKLLQTDVPAGVYWDFSSGVLEIKVPVNLKLSFAVTGSELKVDGNPAQGKREGSFYILRLQAGNHEITGAFPANGLTQFINSTLASLHRPEEETASSTGKKSVAEKPLQGRLSLAIQTKISGKPESAIVIPSVNGDLLAIASRKTVFILNNDGKETGRIEASGDVRTIHWWAEPGLILVGCTDEKVTAYTIDCQKKWEFTSVMDQAVYEAGKQYWFKSAHPGIYGLYSGIFDNGQSRAFVGSACTLEILDINGQLVKRIPVFWGPGRQFLIVNAPDGSKNLLVGRWHNDRETLAIISSRTLTETGSGYNAVPEGHTFVNGWDCMNRFDNYLLDIDGDNKNEIVSAINGTWNRISVYSENGKPLENVQIGPGSKEPRANITMMHAADVNGDGKSEIVFGLSAGYLNCLDYRSEKLWSLSLPSIPVLTRIVTLKEKEGWVCAACADGTILAVNSKGVITARTLIEGKPSDIQIMSSPAGPVAVITDENGNVYGFIYGL